MFGDDEKAAMEEMGKQAAAMMTTSMHAVNIVYDMLIEKPELFRKVAKLYKVAVDALVGEGFTREEAVTMASKVVSAMNIGK